MPAHLYKPIQIAYFVDDIRTAATQMAKLMGAGPFFVVDKIELEWCEYRGRQSDFVHSSAYGQCGDLMMELVQQDCDNPSVFSERHSPGISGIHHLACFVDDLDQAVERYRSLGFEVAARAKAKMGTEFAFIDTTNTLGHMIEIYRADELLVDFYDAVKAVSIDWDGKDILRAFS